jgi:hypothetical protein
LPLAHVRKVDVDGEYIRLGDQADLATGASALAIALRRSDGRVRGSCRRLELKHLDECLCRTEHQVLPGGVAARAGRLALQRRRLHAKVRQSGIEDPLLERHRRAGVGDGVRMVQRGNREIRSGEPSLREQRAEDEDRLIAPLNGLGHVESRPES